MLNYILYEYPVVESTNDIAKSLLENGAGEGTVIRADRQTAGRGRRGREWISESGNLYCSFILKPQCPLSQANQLSFVMALAVGETILSFLSLPESLSYKWPNDLLLNKEKVGGILIETESKGGQQVESCVVGIGVNLQSCPSNMSYPVTSLKNHAKMTPILEVLFSELLDKIKTFYHIWKQDGFEPIREKWLHRAYSLGEDLSIVVGEKKIRGKFIGLDSSGGLLIKGEDNSIQTLLSAEIS